jgi:hypothetical protein
MPYCPECMNEYQPGIEKCTDCGATLIDTRPEDQPWVEVFRCMDRGTAERIRTVVLSDLGTIIHSRSSKAFPSISLSMGQEFIAEERSNVGTAIKLLSEALQDGAIGPDEGELIE